MITFLRVRATRSFARLLTRLLISPMSAVEGGSLLLRAALSSISSSLFQSAGELGSHVSLSTVCPSVCHSALTNQQDAFFSHTSFGALSAFRARATWMSFWRIFNRRRHKPLDNAEAGKDPNLTSKCIPLNYTQSESGGGRLRQKSLKVPRWDLNLPSLPASAACL